MTDRLTRNWLVLIALILATTGLATQDGRIAAAGLLALAWAKSRAILGGFLHLDRAPGWLAAFVVPLGLWLALVWGLAAVR
ncbi:cytochrome C oxidase subunit IV family protein [Paracoccus sp. WLY502]|uniref:cytochrome C oxidase subunit IV family protein n=1 Tax=Paracoccus yibinensis TaxID=3068891 RepID=UPI00279689B2|nr:cytochrome C oxidase subunit IV family protein [Paracoccus sp. WLY502]MDQ1900529.1 cytochrome C oxidase subunit IV family protein [Paracoccus sp. WLY502]